MTVDVPTAGIATAAAAGLWFLVRLTVFDAIKELRASNVRQGERLGAIDKWMEAHDKVETYIERRRKTAATGMPVQDDES